MKTIRTLSWLMLLVLVISMVATACGGGEEATDTPQPTAVPEPTKAPEVEVPTEEYRVGMISDVGGIDDASFNQTTWEGLDRADKEIEGVAAQFLESQAQADYENNITEFAEQGYDMIVTVGFLLGDATAKMAAVYPDIKFAIIDFAYDPPIPNVQGIVFNTDEAAFLAGYLAAGMAVELDPDDPRIGWVGGMQIPPVEVFIVGYESGMAYYNQVKGTNVQASGTYVGDFEAPDEGKTAGNSLLDEGVDIIFGVGGKTGNGGLVAVRERAEAGEAVAGIGVDVDQYFTLPTEQGILITSVEKRLDNAVYNSVDDAVAGNFGGGGVYVGTLENDGVGLAPYHDWEDRVPDELKAEVEALRPQVIAGTISTGWPVGEAEAPEPTGEPKSVTMTFFEEPDTMNPWYTGMWFTVITYEFWLTPMWFFDDNLEMVPELVTEIPSVENGGLSEDGLVVTFRFRDEAVWSDGVPVTADDYVFTYEMIMADGNAVQSRYPFDTFVETVTALDEKTVEVVMNEPYAAWNIGLRLNLLPKHVLGPVYEAEGTIDNAEWNRNPTVGVGPFVFKEWVAASHLVFEANPNYWRGKPNVDQIFIRVTPDDEAQMAAIKTGDTDIGVYMTAANKPDIDALDNVQLVAPGGGGWTESWFFNIISEELAAENGLEPGHVALQDKRVRQAIIMGVDRQQIIDELFYGVYKVPASLWYDTAYEDPDLEPWPYDPEAAMALLDEAGWVDSNGDGTRDKDGVELVLRYSTTAGNELREATQVVAQQMLAEIGVGIEILNYSYDVIWNSFGDGGPVAAGEYDIAEWSTQTTDYPDPNHVEYLCDEIPSADSPAGNNWYGVCIEELDTLFREQAVTADTTARIEMFHEIQRIMHEEALWMGVRSDPDMWALNTRVKNVRFSTEDPFWNSFEWDVD